MKIINGDIYKENNIYTIVLNIENGVCYMLLFESQKNILTRFQELVIPVVDIVKFKQISSYNLVSFSVFQSDFKETKTILFSLLKEKIISLRDDTVKEREKRKESFLEKRKSLNRKLSEALFKEQLPSASKID